MGSLTAQSFRLTWLICFVYSLTMAGQANVPAQPSSSCLAADLWKRLALQQISKQREAGPAAVSPDGSTLVVAIKDGVLSRVEAFDIPSARVLWDRPLDDPADLLTIAPDASQVAARTGVRCKGMPLRHWRLRSGEELPTLAQDGNFDGQVWPSAIAYGPDSIAASVAIVGSVQIWNALSGRTTNTIAGDFHGRIPHQGLAALALHGRKGVASWRIWGDPEMATARRNRTS